MLMSLLVLTCIRTAATIILQDKDTDSYIKSLEGQLSEVRHFGRGGGGGGGGGAIASLFLIVAYIKSEERRKRIP